MIEGGIVLEKQHPRKAQNYRRGLNLDLLASDLGKVGRGVVLHLLAGRKLIVTRGQTRLFPDAVTPTKTAQRRVGQICSLLQQFLVHPHQVALTASI